MDSAGVLSSADMDHAPPSEDQRAAGRARSRWWRRTWLGRCRRPCPPALPPRLSVSSWSGRRHPGRRSRSSITAAGSSACAGSAASARASAGAYRAGPAGGTRPVRQLLLARTVRSPEPIGSSRGRAAPIGGYATRVPALVRHARW